MIEFLTGVVRCKRASSLIIDVGGVGYGVALPLSQLIQLGEIGSSLSLWIFTRVREDHLSLYGFLEESDRIVFEILINCNGVGPKVALAIMSTMTSYQLKEAIGQKNLEVFEAVPGIGRRTAEKIQVDLQAKLDKFPPFNSQNLACAPIKNAEVKQKNLFEKEQKVLSFPEHFKYDLSSALSNLGFKDKDIHPILSIVKKEYNGEDFSSVTRKALSLLSSQKQGSSKKKDKSNVDFNTLF